MSPEFSPTGDAIDKHQIKLDAADGVSDSRIDAKNEKSEASTGERLTALYIGKVNDLQGRLAEAKRTVEILKNARSPHWQQLEKVCSEVENGLLQKFSVVHPETITAAAEEFDQEIQTLIATLTIGMQKQSGESNDSALDKNTEKLRAACEAAKDRSKGIQRNIDALRGREENFLRQLTKETKDGSYNFLDLLTSKIAAAEKGIQLIVDEIKRLRLQIQEQTTELQKVEGLVMTLEVLLIAGEARKDDLAGRTEVADRRRTLLLEKYGEHLKDIDATIAERAMESAQRLSDNGKLSAAEQALLFGNPNSPEALRKAIESKQTESGSADIIDQIRTKQTFRAGAFEKYAPANVFYNGQDVSGALSVGVRTTLTYSTGRTLNVIATQGAQKLLENIPAGKEPVLLRPIASMNMTGGVGRGNTRLTLKNAPADFTVRQGDIGFVDVSGNIVEDDGKTPIDLSQNEHRETIEAQIRNQKGFRLEAYRPRFPLRTLDGKPYPYGLNTLKTQSGVTIDGVTVAQDAIKLINAEPPKGQTLVLKRIPRGITLRTPEVYGGGPRGGGTTLQRVLDTDMVRREDLAYAKIEGDTLTTQNIGSEKKTETSVSEAEKEQEEKTRDIQRVLDRNPAIHGVKRAASTIQQTTGNLQKFLEASKAGSAREAFVKFAREEAKPTLEMLKDPKLRQDIDQARSVLLQLKGISGVALGGLEKQIDAQLKALDGFTAMLADGRTQHLLETIMDASKFDADTWANFFKNELPVIVASIVLACAAAALVVVTCGTATPFIAVAGATALGGVVGAELGKEAVYAGHQLLDGRVRSGEATFTERSKTGKYVEGQKLFNEETGKYEDREFFRDVGNPLAQEFAQAFVVTLATMGIGNVVGAQLSKLLQNSKIVDKLTARSDILKAVARKLANLNQQKEVLEKATGLKDAIARALKTLPKEVGEEFGDEAQESILEKFLNQLDLSLAASDGVNGKIGLGTAAAMLLAIAKNTRIGKATISYDVSGKDSKTIQSKAQAIRAEAEANGAVVTDLGKGVLSIRHPVEVNGKVEYETVQMVPSVSVESDVATGADTGKAENQETEGKTSQVPAEVDQTIVTTENQSSIDPHKEIQSDQGTSKVPNLDLSYSGPQPISAFDPFGDRDGNSPLRVRSIRDIGPDPWENTDLQASRESYVSSDDFWNLAGTEGVTEQQLSDLLQRTYVGNVWSNMIDRELRSRLDRGTCKPAQLVQVFSAAHSFFAAQKVERYTDKLRAEAEHVVAFLLQRKQRGSSSWSAEYVAEDATAALDIARECQIPISDEMRQAAEDRFQSFAAERPDLAVAFAQEFSISMPVIRAAALANIDEGTVFEELRKVEGSQLDNENPEVQEAAGKRVWQVLYLDCDIEAAKRLRDSFAITDEIFRRSAEEGLLAGLRFHIALDQLLKAERELGLSIDKSNPHVQEQVRIAFEFANHQDPILAARIRDHFGLDPMANEATRKTAIFEMQQLIQEGTCDQIRALQTLYQMSDTQLKEILLEGVTSRYKYLRSGEKEKVDQWCRLFETNGLLSSNEIRSAKKDAFIDTLNLGIAADIQTDGDYVVDAVESKEKLASWHTRCLENGNIMALDAVGRYCDLSDLDNDPAAHAQARNGIIHILSRGRGTASARVIQERYGISEIEYNEDVRSSIIEAHANRWEDTAKQLASEYDMEGVRTGPEAKARRIGNILLSLHWSPDPRNELQKEVAKYVASTKKQLAHDNFTDADIESALGKELIQHLQGAKEENLEYVRQIAQNFDIRNLVQQPGVMDAVRGLLSKNTFYASQEIMKLMHVDPDLESCIPFMEEGSKNRMIAEACGAKTVQEFFELRPSFEYMKETVLQLLYLTPRERRIDYAKVILELHNDDVSSDMRKTRQELTALIVETDDPVVALASIQAIYAGTGSLISKVCLTYDALHPHRKITLPLDQYDLPFLQQLDAIDPDNRAAYVPIFQRVSNSPSEEIKRVQDQIIQLILTCDDPLVVLEKIESVFVKNNIPMIGKIYRVFEILYPTEILDGRITNISSPFLQKAGNTRRRATIYKDLMKAHVLSGNRNLRGFLEVLQSGEQIIGMLDDPEKTLTATERKQVTYALMKFETLFEHSQAGKQSDFVAERISGDLTDADIRSRYQSLRASLGVQEHQSLHSRIVQMFADPLGLHSVDEVLETMRNARSGAHERNTQAASEGLSLEEGDLIKGVQEQFIGNIFQNGSVAVEYLGADSGQDGTPFDTDVSIVAKDDVSDGFRNVINQSIAGYDNTYGNILLVVKNRNQFQVTNNETTDFDSSKYELFPIGFKGSNWSRHGGVRTGFPSTEIDFIVAKKDLDPRDRQNLFFEIAKNGFYIPVTDVQGNIIFTPEMYTNLRKNFDGLERFEGSPLTIASETSSRHLADIHQSTQEVLAQRAATHEQMRHIESVVSDVLSEYGTELKSVYDTSLGGVRLDDTGSTGRGTQLSGSSDFDFVLKLDSSNGEQSLFAKSEEIAQKIQEKLQPKEARVESTPNGGKQLRTFGCKNCDGVDIDIGFIPSSDISDFGSHNAVAEKLRWIAKHEGQDVHDRTVANIVLAKKLLKSGNAYKKQEHGGIGGIGVENWILSNECNVLTAFRSFMNAAVDSKGTIVPLEDFKQRYGAIDPGVNVRFGTQGENFFRGLTEGGYRSMIAAISEYTGTRVAPETMQASPQVSRESDSSLQDAMNGWTKEKTLSLPETAEGRSERVRAAGDILGVPLSDAQEKAVLAAHDIPMADGQKYSSTELAQKMKILESAEFTREQALELLRMGVCGFLPKWLRFGKAEVSPDQQKSSEEGKTELPESVRTALSTEKQEEFREFVSHLEETVQDTVSVSVEASEKKKTISAYTKKGYVLVKEGSAGVFDEDDGSINLSFERPMKFDAAETEALLQVFQSFEQPRTTLKRLQDMGVQFSTSDLHGGSSAMQYLSKGRELEAFFKKVDSLSIDTSSLHSLWRISEAADFYNQLDAASISTMTAIAGHIGCKVQMDDPVLAKIAGDPIALDVLKRLPAGEGYETIRRLQRISDQSSYIALQEVLILNPSLANAGVSALGRHLEDPSWSILLTDADVRSFVTGVVQKYGVEFSHVALERCLALNKNRKAWSVVESFCEEFCEDQEIARNLTERYSYLAELIQDPTKVAQLQDPEFLRFARKLKDSLGYQDSLGRLVSPNNVVQLWQDPVKRAQCLEEETLRLGKHFFHDDARQCAGDQSYWDIVFSLQEQHPLLGQHLDALKQDFGYTVETGMLTSLLAFGRGYDSNQPIPKEELGCLHRFTQDDTFRSTFTSERAKNNAKILTTQTSYQMRLQDIAFLDSVDLSQGDGRIVFETAAELHAAGIEFHPVDQWKLLQAIGRGQMTKIFIDLDPKTRDFVLQYLSPIIAMPQGKRLDFIAIFKRLSHSPSQELQLLKNELATQLIMLDDPSAAYERIATLFERNNLPLIGKLNAAFSILYPPQRIFEKMKSHTSPRLGSAAKRMDTTENRADKLASFGRATSHIFYRDLLNIHVRSGENSLHAFALAIEQGGEVLSKLETNGAGALSTKEREQMHYLLLKLETLTQYSHTGLQQGFIAEGSADKIQERYNAVREAMHATEGQTVSDRVSQMFLRPLGYESIREMLQDMDTIRSTTDQRNRAFADQHAESGLALHAGDLLHGTDGNYVGKILQSGLTAGEFFGAGKAHSDLTPFDADFSKVLPADVSDGHPLDTALQASIAAEYVGKAGGGGVMVLVRDRGQFEITREYAVPDERVPSDRNRYEKFSTPEAGERHYGVRTGLPSSELDAFIVQNGPVNNRKAFQELTLHIVERGFYIPVFDMKGALVFSPEQYDVLRRNYTGLTDRYGPDFALARLRPDSDPSLREKNAGDIQHFTEMLRTGTDHTPQVSAAAQTVIQDVLTGNGIELKNPQDHSLGGARMFDIGSTGRGTHLPGGGYDFDYTMRIDDSGDESPFSKHLDIVAMLKKEFGGTDDSHALDAGGYQLRLGGCAIGGETVDIDIAIMPNSEVDYLPSHEAVEKRLDWIRIHHGEGAYLETKANILLAKSQLKEGKAYKKVEDGGFGGIGVENWILQNGGSFVEACRTFRSAAYDTNGERVPLDEFKNRYSIVNPGVNFRDKQHDDYIRYLKQTGYDSMLFVVERYLGEGVVETESVSPK